MTKKNKNSFLKNYLYAIRNLFRSIALPILIILLGYSLLYDLTGLKFPDDKFSKYVILIYCFYIFLLFFSRFLNFLFLSAKQLRSLNKFGILTKYSFLFLNLLIATFIALTTFIRFKDQYSIFFNF